MKTIKKLGEGIEWDTLAAGRPKAHVGMRFDPEVLEALKARAEVLEVGYQTLANAILRRALGLEDRPMRKKKKGDGA